VCDRTETADALNQRLHHDAIDPDAATVSGARGHRIAVGDLILTRRNDAAILVRDSDGHTAEGSPVRNGQRWQVTHINPDNNRLIARRLDDHTLGAFPNDYVREHITYGYALTVHSAQGATADTTHALLSDNGTRALAYVALTRGRDANTAYLCEPTTEHERQDESTERGHVAIRRNSRHAATLLRGIIAHDERPATALDAAKTASPRSLPNQVVSAIQRRTQAAKERSRTFKAWCARVSAYEHAAQTTRGRVVTKELSVGDHLEI
jgi:hypothetical protein